MPASNDELRAVLKSITDMLKVEPPKGKEGDMLWFAQGGTNRVCMCGGLNSYQIASIREVKAALKLAEQVLAK